MKTVVVTGSTRGIGRGLAEEFLKRNCQVVVSGRSQSGVDAVVNELKANHPDRVAGFACDIAKFDDLQNLWEQAKQRFGRIDVWINNAGMSIERGPLAEAKPEDLQAIVATNLTGMLFANRVAIAGMQEQGGGQIWNMEGFGSNGMTQPGIIPYGATKRAVRYIIAGLQKELKGSPVHVCTLSPGIVITDLLLGDYDRESADWERVKRIFNILGDKVETVTPWLAEQVLATDRPGANVSWLTTPKVIGRFLMARFRKRDLFEGMEGV